MIAIARLILLASVILIGTGADIYAARNDVPGMGLHVGVALLAIASICYIAIYNRFFELHFARTPSWLFTLLLGWGVICTPLADDIGLALLTLSRYIVIFITAVILISIAGKGRKFESVLNTGVHFSIYILTSTIAIDAIQPGTFSKILTRPAGLAENPNGAAQLLAMLLTMILLLEHDKPPNRKLMMTSAAAITGIFMTLSRGGFVMAVTLILAILLLKVSKFRNISVPLIAACLGVGAFLMLPTVDSIAIFQNQTTMTRMERLVDLSYYTDTSDSRFELAQSYFAYASPWFGSGPGATALVDAFGGATHNTFLKMYWESGIIGAILYTLIIFIPLFIARSGVIILSVSIMTFLSLVTNYNMDNRSFHLLVIITYMIAGLIRVERRNRYIMRDDLDPS